MSSQKKVSLTLTLRQVNCLRIAAGSMLDHDDKHEWFRTDAEVRAADAAYKKITKIVQENYAELYPTEEDDNEGQ